MSAVFGARRSRVRPPGRAVAAGCALSAAGTAFTAGGGVPAAALPGHEWIGLVVAITAAVATGGGLQRLGGGPVLFWLGASCCALTRS